MFKMQFTCAAMLAAQMLLGSTSWASAEELKVHYRCGDYEEFPGNVFELDSLRGDGKVDTIFFCEAEAHLSCEDGLVLKYLPSDEELVRGGLCTVRACCDEEDSTPFATPSLQNSYM